MLLPRWLLVPLVLAGWLGAVGPAGAVAPQLKDEGKFFSPEAIEKANQKVKEIARDFSKDLLIETVAGIPPALEQKYKEQGKQDFFRSWAIHRAGDVGVKGIYILICKDPPHLQVEVDKATRAKGFPLTERDRLVEKIVALLKAKKNDEVLQETIDFVQSTLRTNLKSASPAPAKP